MRKQTALGYCDLDGGLLLVPFTVRGKNRSRCHVAVRGGDHQCKRRGRYCYLSRYRDVMGVQRYESVSLCTQHSKKSTAVRGMRK